MVKAGLCRAGKGTRPRHKILQSYGSPQIIEGVTILGLSFLSFVGYIRERTECQHLDLQASQGFVAVLPEWVTNPEL